MSTKRIGSLILILTIVASLGFNVFAEEAVEPEQYIASAGFSTTQGENNWYYRSRNCNTNAVSELTTTASSDGTTVWRQGGGNDRGYISKDTILPGINASAVYDRSMVNGKTEIQVINSVPYIISSLYNALQFTEKELINLQYGTMEEYRNSA